MYFWKCYKKTFPLYHFQCQHMQVPKSYSHYEITAEQYVQL